MLENVERETVDSSHVSNLRSRATQDRTGNGNGKNPWEHQSGAGVSSSRKPGTLLTEEELAVRFHEQKPKHSAAIKPLCNKVANVKFKEFLLSLFPVLSWARSYSIKRDLMSDMIAGITVGILVIPQGLSYGLLAGLPAIYGLYAILAAPLVYMLVGASPEVHLGPFALISLLVVDTVGGVVDVDTEGELVYQEAVVTVTFMVGIILLLLAALQMGVLVDFLSEPVMSGLTTAGALLIATSQLKHLCGIDIPSLPFYDTIYYLFSNLDRVNWVTFALGMSSLVLQAGLDEANRRFQRLKSIKIPSGLIVLVLGIVLVQSLELNSKHGVEVLGDIPQGLPEPRVPGELHNMGRLVVPALVIAVVGYALTMATSKTFAARKGREVPANRELFALSCANFAGCFFLGYPAFASLSRSAVVDSLGAHTPLHNLFSTLIVILVLQFLTAQLYHLPYAILSSVIFLSLKNLFKQFAVPLRLWKIMKADAFLWVFTFFMTLSLQIVYGLIGGVVLSIIFLLRSVSRPSVAILGMLPDVMLYKDNNRYRNAIDVPGILIFRFDSPLHFANKDYFTKSIIKAVWKRLSTEQERRILEKRNGKKDPTSPGEHSTSTDEHPTSTDQQTMERRAGGEETARSASCSDVRLEEGDLVRDQSASEAIRKGNHLQESVGIQEHPVVQEGENEKNEDNQILGGNEEVRIDLQESPSPLDESAATQELVGSSSDKKAGEGAGSESTIRCHRVGSADTLDSVLEYNLHTRDDFHEHFYLAKQRLDSCSREGSIITNTDVDLIAVVVDAAGITELDSSAFNALTRLQAELKGEYKVELVFANCRGKIRDRLIRAGVNIRTFLSIDAAVLFCRKFLD